MSKAVPERAIGCWGKRYGHYIFGNDPRTEEKYVVTSFDMDGGAVAEGRIEGEAVVVARGTLDV